MAGAVGCTTGAGEEEETGVLENEQPAMRADTISNETAWALQQETAKNWKQ